ncbi:MAG: copper chaperone PCu(A)C [Ignavibacteriales bacterium]|nr:MAG: copper chaperone PCu(A)C [Ignavibacteriales bacterium]
MLYIISFLMFLLQPNTIEVKNAWIRPGAKGMNTAAYFEIANKGNKPDTLFNVKSSLSKIVELHETYKIGDAMGMRKTPIVVVPAKTSFYFKPGGNHVMLIDLKNKIPIGKSGDITLYFKRTGKIKISAEVKK